MARQIGKWSGDWHSFSWASARAVWIRPTAEQDAEDALSWESATTEDGGFIGVLWCELRQLVGDVAQPPAKPCKPRTPRRIE